MGRVIAFNRLSWAKLVLLEPELYLFCGGRKREGRAVKGRRREDRVCLQGAAYGKVMEGVCVYGWAEGVQLSQKTSSVSSEKLTSCCCQTGTTVRVKALRSGAATAISSC